MSNQKEKTQGRSPCNFNAFFEKKKNIFWTSENFETHAMSLYRNTGKQPKDWTKWSYKFHLRPQKRKEEEQINFIFCKTTISDTRHKVALISWWEISSLRVCCCHIYCKWQISKKRFLWHVLAFLLHSLHSLCFYSQCTLHNKLYSRVRVIQHAYALMLLLLPPPHPPSLHIPPSQYILNVKLYDWDISEAVPQIRRVMKRGREI